MKTVLLLLVGMITAGCASPSHWAKHGGTSEAFHMDLARCRMQMASLPQPVYADTTYLAPEAAAGVMLQNAGADLGAAADRMQFMDDCLHVHGWHLVPDRK